jgi:hypothetical protein
MLEDNDANKSKKEAPLPHRSVNPTLILAPILQDDIVGKPSKPNNEAPAEEIKKSEKIVVEIARDDELKPFEEKALFWARWGVVLGALTLALVAVTLAVFYRQLRELQVQTDTSRSMANQAVQDSISAENKNMEQLALDRRAWLGATEVRGILEVGKPLEMTVQFKNSGKTPARHVAIDTCYRSVSTGNQFTFDCPEDKKGGSKGMLFPGGVFYARVAPYPGKVVEQADLPALRSRQVTMFVFGRVRYDDIFDHPHWTQFCYSLAIAPTGWAVCTEHNDTDDSDHPQSSNWATPERLEVDFRRGVD